LLGDDKRVSPALAGKLTDLARSEKNVEVRSQLACTAKRLSATAALPIVRNLLAHDEDADDVHLPLLLWWALESKCDKDRERVLELFDDSTVWRLPLVQKHVLHRLMRRFASAGTRKDLLICARLLKLSPDAERSKILMRGFEEAFQGRSLSDLPVELAEALARFGGTSIALGLRQNKPEAIAKALALIADDKADPSERLQYVRIFGEVKQPRSVPVLLALLEKARDDGLRLASLTALQTYDEPRIAEAVLKKYGTFTDDARAVAQTLLVSRKAWAISLLAAIDAGRIDRATVPLDVVRKMTMHRDERIARLVKKHWGKIEGAASAAMQKQIERLGGVLKTGTGSPYRGKKLFADSCAKCHKLFGQGGAVGPDLTTYQRDDLSNMLANVVNPSAEIREGFETYLVSTKDGRVLTGLLVDKDNRVIVLRGADGQSVTVRQTQIEELTPQRKSLMPEGLLDKFSDQQVRDLFAYLRSTQPLND
jgi:putative heme-binding domain-containing protein